MWVKDKFLNSVHCRTMWMEEHTEEQHDWSENALKQCEWREHSRTVWMKKNTMIWSTDTSEKNTFLKCCFYMWFYLKEHLKVWNSRTSSLERSLYLNGFGYILCFNYEDILNNQWHSVLTWKNENIVWLYSVKYICSIILTSSWRFQWMQ